MNHDYIRNGVSGALFERIVRAHRWVGSGASPGMNDSRRRLPCRRREQFRVYVFVPLVVCFAGEIGNSKSLDMMLYFAYSSLCRGQHSLLHNLEKESARSDASV